MASAAAAPSHASSRGSARRASPAAASSPCAWTGVGEMRGGEGRGFESRAARRSQELRAHREGELRTRRAALLQQPLQQRGDHPRGAPRAGGAPPPAGAGRLLTDTCAHEAGDAIAAARLKLRRRRVAWLGARGGDQRGAELARDAGRLHGKEPPKLKHASSGTILPPGRPGKLRSPRRGAARRRSRGRRGREGLRGSWERRP